MQISKNDGQLEIFIRDNFDFEKCRELLASCKAHAKSTPEDRVTINLENISTFQSCAIATLSLISDWMPGGLQINLRNCATEVQQVFDSGIFDEYFSKNCPYILSICNTCLVHNCRPSDQACTQSTIHMLLNND